MLTSLRSIDPSTTLDAASDRTVPPVDLGIYTGRSMLHVKGEQWRSELEEYRPAEIRIQVRDGAESSTPPASSAWPTEMRVIIQEERPHSCAQLRFTDSDGLQLSAFAPNARVVGSRIST